MKYNQLGRTGLFVSELCLGTMTFGGHAGLWKTIGGLGQAEADVLIRRALDAGINFIDTADCYSCGQSEHLVGQALKNSGVNRSEVVIATKVGVPMSAGANARGASRGHLMNSVQASLKRLQLDYIDLYQIHANDPATPIEETLRALDDLTRQGLIRYAGVSNWRAGKIGKALGLSAAQGATRFETLQAYYSIAGRDAERELVPLIMDEQMGLLVWSPLAGGLLSDKFGSGRPAAEGARRLNFDFPPVNRDRASACIAEIRKIADDRDVSVARIAIGWLLAKPHVTSVIIGAKRIEQLEDNIAATRVVLTAEELTRLDAVSELPGEYPGWMIAAQDPERWPSSSQAG